MLDLDAYPHVVAVNSIWECCPRGDSFLPCAMSGVHTLSSTDHIADDATVKPSTRVTRAREGPIHVASKPTGHIPRAAMPLSTPKL